MTRRAPMQPPSQSIFPLEPDVAFVPRPQTFKKIRR